MARGEGRFYLELAEKLSMTKAELLSRISSAELTEWMVLWKLRAQEQKQSQGGRGRR